MNTEERVEQVTNHLRQLAEEIDDKIVEDAADLIDELMAELFVVDEQLAALTSPQPSSSESTPAQQRLRRGSSLDESGQRRETAIIRKKDSE